MTTACRSCADRAPACRALRVALGRVALGWMLVCAPAAAQEVQSPADAPAPDRAEAGDPVARAEALLEEGVNLRLKSQDKQALERFREAHALHPTPRSAGQLGMVQRALRLYVEAETNLNAALSAPRDTWVEQNRELLEQNLELVEKNLGWVLVESNVEGAQLLINGQPVARLPLETPLRVVAGQAVVAVRAAGHQQAEEQVTVAARETARVSLKLEPEPVAPPAAPDVAPANPEPPAPQPAPTAPDSAPAAEEASGAKRLAWIAGGVGVAGLAVGSVFGLLALDRKSEADELCPEVECSDRDGLNADQDGRRFATYSTVGFVVGIAGVGLSTVLFATGGGSSATRAPGRRPVAAAPVTRLRLGPGSLWLDGQF